MLIRDMPPYVEAYPNENLTTVMPEQYRYTLPVKAGEQRLLGELTGAACATLVAEIAERHAGPVVLIAPDMQNALRLHDEISQFTDQMVMNLADWETLPYDSFSPHQDIISSRLSTLYQLPTMQRGVLIVPVNTLMQRVCPHSFLHGHALVMKKGQRLSRDALRTQLDSAGYRHVDQVMEHGEYATRGALLDRMEKAVPYCDARGLAEAREAVCAYHLRRGLRGVEPEDVLLGKALREAGVRVLHIDNPVAYTSFEDNARYLAKVDEALGTLHAFADELQGYSPLLSAVSALRRARLLRLVRVFHKCFGKALRAKLCGCRPQLLLLKLYKLGFFACLG